MNAIFDLVKSFTLFFGNFISISDSISDNLMPKIFEITLLKFKQTINTYLLFLTKNLKIFSFSEWDSAKSLIFIILEKY